MKKPNQRVASNSRYAIRLVAVTVTTIVIGCRPPPVELSEAQFVGAFRSNYISRAKIIYEPSSPVQEVRGQWRRPGQAVGEPFRAKLRLTPQMEQELMASRRFQVSEQKRMGTR